MSKSAKKQLAVSSTVAASVLKVTRQAVGDPKTKKSDRASKQSHVITMLQSPKGATIAAMMKATCWKQHSVRGFLAGVVRKRLKLQLHSARVDGERIYRVAGVPNTNLGTSQTKHRTH